MVAGVLDTFYDISLVCLIRLREFSDALLLNVRSLREPLVITGLPGAVRRCSPVFRIVFKFIERNFVMPQFTPHHDTSPDSPQSSPEQWLLIR